MPRAIWEERGKWAGKNLALFLMSLPIILVGIYVLIKASLKSCFKKPIKSSPRIEELEAPLIDPRDFAHPPVADGQNGIELKEMQLNLQLIPVADSSSHSSSSSASSSTRSSPDSLKSSTYCMLTEDSPPSSGELSSHRKIHFDTKEISSTVLTSQRPLLSNSYPELDCAMPVRKKAPREEVDTTYQISMWDDLSSISQHGVDWYVAKHGAEAILRFFAPVFAGIEMAGAITITTAELILRDIENSNNVSIQALQKYFNIFMGIATLTTVLSGAVWPKRFVNPLVRAFQVQAAFLLGTRIMRYSGILSTQEQASALGVSTSTGFMLFQAAKSAHLLEFNSPKLKPSVNDALNSIVSLINKAVSGYCVGISASDVWATFDQLFIIDFPQNYPFIIGFSSALGLASVLWGVELGKRCNKPHSTPDKFFKGITVLVEGLLDNASVLGSQFLRFVAFLMVDQAVIERGDYSDNQKIQMVIYTAIAAVTGAVFEAIEIGNIYDKERIEEEKKSSHLDPSPSQVTQMQLATFERIVGEAKDLVTSNSPLMMNLVTNHDETTHHSEQEQCAVSL